jgi:L-seryl-tRNA(Ser) seleniumtransferase
MLMRRPPSMERLLSDSRSAPLIARYGRLSLKRAASEVIRAGSVTELAGIFEASAGLLAWQFDPDLLRVVNATGILIHTNLGRAPLSESARLAVAEAAAGYQSVEIDLESGRRGVRGRKLRALIASFLGAEDAIAVNNNAAAVLLALSATSAGRDVLVSRGELVAIGGSFKIPEILEASGARLREVGTTNRTKIEDYERAYSRQTSALLTVHPSNYEIKGYAKRPTFVEIASFARRKKIPWIHDHGSGNPIDLECYGISGEEMISDARNAGAALVAFSGDKLFGGPQAGILAGRRKWIEACRSHPLARALRADKLTMAGLFATVADWVTRGPAALPVHALAAGTVSELRSRAESVARALPPGITAEVVETRALFGGGTTPEKSLASAGLAVTSATLSPDELARRLRSGRPPVVGRVERGRLILDFRAIFPEEDSVVGEALAKTSSDLSRGPSGAAASRTERKPAARRTGGEP